TGARRTALAAARRRRLLLGDLDRSEQLFRLTAMAVGSQTDAQEANGLAVLGEGVFLHLHQAAAAQRLEQQFEAFALERLAAGAVAKQLAGGLTAAAAQRHEGRQEDARLDGVRLPKAPHQAGLGSADVADATGAAVVLLVAEVADQVQH